MKTTFVVAFVSLGLLGCADVPAEDFEQSVSALESTGLPTGAVCGLQYERPGMTPHGVACMGRNSMSYIAPGRVCLGISSPTAPAGFAFAFDGDFGLPSCNGFGHFRFAQPNATPSTMYRLPRGTACGFKGNCNDAGERCLGFDAAISCPAGWVQKISTDMNAAHGCGFSWCEYQDPNNLCTTTACRVDNQPVGLVCGITDGDRNNGQCQGLLTTQGCPAGYVRSGFYDDGRPAGHGVGWCQKDLPAIP